jgi:hypothetical protein
MTQVGKVDILDDEIEAANEGAERLLGVTVSQGSYRVEWAIDIEADSPRQAAAIACTRHMRRTLPAQHDDACVFDVSWEEPDGSFGGCTIDLAEAEDGEPS